MRLLSGLTALMWLAAAFFADYPEAPPLAHTGGFGEPTCQRCHFDGPLNDPTGTLTLGGIDDDLSAGKRYRLEVRLARPGLRRGGFQLAARFEDGQQAGGFETVDGRVAVVRADSSGVLYAHQNAAGTEASARDTLRWVIEWTAPDTASARILFHAAANAANDDASEFGDWIYTGAWKKTIAP